MGRETECEGLRTECEGLITERNALNDELTSTRALMATNAAVKAVTPRLGSTLTPRSEWQLKLSNGARGHGNHTLPIVERVDRTHGKCAQCCGKPLHGS